MSARKRYYTAERLAINPATFGAALAHIVADIDGKEVVLGQAWLAGSNRLATCGHVVDHFKDKPGDLSVKFPASGNQFAVRQVKLHPRFLRQPDGLVRFDAAVIYVDLQAPEKYIDALPIAFAKQISVNQQVSAFRYPAHLGSLTAAPNPVTQFGRMLGPLRKDDAFHLLHDLSLTAGDSGAAVFDGKTIVAIHCGDTATIPGLNLPTTAIRLGLWIEALKELGIEENAALPVQGRQISVRALIAMLVSALVLSFAAGYGLWIMPQLGKWEVKQAAVLPVDISFNKSLKQYKAGDVCKMIVMPRSDCYLYLFAISDSAGKQSVSKAYMLYPPYLPNGYKSFVHAGQAKAIDGFGNSEIVVQPSKGKLHLVAFSTDTALLADSDFVKEDPSTNPLTISGEELLKRIQLLESQNPTGVLHAVLDAPSGN